MIEIGVGFALAVLVLAWPRRSFDGPAAAERFVIDDGSPGAYHAPGLARREVLAEALAWLGERLSLDVVLVAGATSFVLVELVILRGIKEGWWRVLWDFAQTAGMGDYQG
ncbi:hypothetical protein [Paludisphaera rhizosphaerae]|uniref:hypothetical protein n=1 Tax=Paludisphaera rhizosphaerae TaxID=2711216 RepID=UPI0013ED4AE9|nr:hypothetical protein [Paludisphaera rhizosphaerae]